MAAMTPKRPGADLLTDEQRAVVDLPGEAALLVTAGAGTGKTHTMIRRIARLLEDEEVAAHEVLVLSFARSAVRELGDRLASTGDAGRFVRVRTFDAFALDLLFDLDVSQDWPTVEFDRRIEEAARLIREGVADDRLAELRHLVVDEAQDLVGVRLDLAAALLERTECGFTIVGDAAQSIYGFQVDDPDDRIESADACFGMLRRGLADDLVEMELTQNFRARTDEVRAAMPFGPTLRRSAEAAEARTGQYEELRTTLMEAMLLGRLDDPFTVKGLDAAGRTTAVLCRTNGEALVVSEHLAAADVVHRVRRRAQDQVAPAWLAGLFRTHHGPVLTRGMFDDLAGPFLHVLQPDLVWRQLLRIAGDRGRAVDMARLRDAIAARRLPDDFTAQPAAGLIVSTFHRAKGLEFDRVVVVDPDRLRERSDTPEAEESRLLYVAMTRAREELYRVEPIRSFSVRSCDRADRWARFGRERYQRHGMEVLGRDVASDHPAATDEDGATTLQGTFGSDLAVGDPVELVANPWSEIDAAWPTYRVLRDGRTIGQTSGTFGTSLFRLLGGHRRWQPSRYPKRITGVRIDAVETVAGSPAAGRRADLGPYGVWLAPRLVGLSRFRWKDDE